MPGFPIRTSSDHSSVDSSPRPIAASHVLHRLLMPRHPPCALTHLFTTRCSHPLCNTQHTTTHPSTTTTTTPTTSPPTSEETIDALDGPPEQRPEKPPTPPETGRDACPLRTQQRAEPPTILKFRYVPPSHTPPTPTTAGAGAFNGADIVKGEPPAFRAGRTTSPHGETP